ncbi:MAG: sigma-54-dependent transcriptional regulator [Candidatus Binatia bacterium]
MNTSILVVDDETVLAKAIADFLGHYDYSVGISTTGEEALLAIKQEPPDIVVLDYRLPRMDGLKVLRKIKETRPEIEVIMMTAHGSVAGAVEAMKLGAFDYVAKPIDLEELGLTLNRVSQSLHRSHELDYLRSRAARNNPSHEIIGQSEGMQQVRTLIDRISSIEINSGLGAPAILITGETGTGKELVARGIHHNSCRASGPFVDINCAAIPTSLLEAELFGYEKGSFTDAKAQKIGLFEAADGGTLFLDEIGSMELNLQAKLLKAIEERTVRRLGSLRGRRFDVMILAASNQPLEQAIQDQTFRQDLYYRLKVLTVNLPPLRERGDDAVFLAEHFVHLHSRRYSRGDKRLTDTAKTAIARYSWPGNVRELRNMTERAVLLTVGKSITPVDLGFSPIPIGIEPSPAGTEGNVITIDISRGVVLEELEQTIIQRVLAHTGWNRTKAAQLLGLSRETLRYRIEKYNLQAPASPLNP